METLSWERLRQHLESGAPWLLSMGSTTPAKIGFLEGRMFLQIPISAAVSVPAAAYADLTVQVVLGERGPLFEVYTQNRGLFREFHYFAQLFVEEVAKSTDSIVAAFNRSLKRWLELGAERSLLTADQRLGLLGELWFLLSLLRAHGAVVATAWTGRNEKMPDRHDFRLANIDIEVKSTRATRREHVIHGLKQLTPSLDHTLFILSLRFESAGASGGRSLPDCVADIRRSLAAAPELEFFDRQLLSAGYRDTDAPFYGERMKLADAPVLVKVDALCPRLTEDTLGEVLGMTLSSRIKDVSYRADLEGLGDPQGTADFSAVLGKLEIK